ncbi:ComF family protein [Faecalicatena sp. AGMB00832]|uniref:ComF family protein n=1 Tax=Faecalicatena faecalis TaxID=2726362 RepID=A0ABS6CZL5_9FIRM|nr:ComF family protein [Faecalicatena faecalis]MBU3874753.1 ComF family protein [Faecalicatena faecalis]
MYPPVCPFCGRISREGICSLCRKRLPYISEPRCMRCGKPLEKEEQEYCRDCGRHSSYYEQGRSIWLHRPPVSQAIYRLKYKNKRNYGKVFAQEMARCYGAQIKRWGVQEIVPVPLHKRRQRKRGYNQAAILAEELGKLLHLPVDADVVLRIRDTRPQKELNDAQRSKNLKGAFAAAGHDRVKPVVLVIDDIYTTGSTIQRVAKMLKMAGAEKVYFLTISIGQGL